MCMKTTYALVDRKEVVLCKIAMKQWEKGVVGHCITYYIIHECKMHMNLKFELRKCPS